ncbi:MAG: hypothetical protein ACLUNX_02535 [Angelakisella sp.]
MPFQILCFNCGIIADIDCFIGRNGGEFIRIICGLDFGVVAGDGDIAFCIDGVAADDSRGDLGCILDIKRAAYIKARRDFIAIFSALALCGAVIGDGDGAAGEGGIAADLDGGNTIGGAGGFEGTVRYGEVAFDIDGSSSIGFGSNSSAAGDGEILVGFNCIASRSTCISSYSKVVTADYNRSRSIISGCNSGVASYCFYLERTRTGNLEITRLEIRIDAICASGYAIFTLENDIRSAIDARRTSGINISIFNVET